MLSPLLKHYILTCIFTNGSHCLSSGCLYCRPAFITVAATQNALELLVNWLWCKETNYRVEWQSHGGAW